METLLRNIVVAGLVGALLALSACAGELDDPERFDFLLGDDAAVPMPPAGDGDGDGDGDSGDGDSGDGDSGDGDSMAGDGDGDSMVGDGDGDSTLEPPPACVTEIFMDSCGSPGCHAAGQVNVDLVSDGVADRLFDQEATGALCSGRPYISTDGSGSLLLQKLESDVDCGGPMPLGGMLEDSEKQCLSDWVESIGGDTLGDGA